MGNQPGTILIVDDDKTVIEQLATHFRRRGYEPIATANPTIVEQTLENFQVHLILLDLRMERLDGYEVLKNLRQRNIGTPVLIITAYYQDERERLKNVGISKDDVIEKPFRDFSRIETCINRKLNRVVVPAEVGTDYEEEIYADNRTHVVLVDDETEMSDILKEVLQTRRYEVTVFTKGNEALDYILKNDCHLAIVDMKVPGLSGDQLIQKALASKPSLKIIPVSAAYAPEMKELLARVGFDPRKLVTKPFDLATLVEQMKVLATEAGTLGTRV
jgi:DNA-binding response OmpR family regulator